MALSVLKAVGQGRTAPEPQQQVEGDALDTSTVHDLLSNARRRYAVEALATRGPLAKGELIDAVAHREYGLSSGGVGAKERKRVQVSLYQCHNPALVEHGVIVEEGDTYTLGPNADALLEYLDVGGRGMLGWSLPF